MELGIFAPSISGATHGRPGCPFVVSKVETCTDWRWEYNCELARLADDYGFGMYFITILKGLWTQEPFDFHANISVSTMGSSNPNRSAQYGGLGLVIDNGDPLTQWFITKAIAKGESATGQRQQVHNNAVSLIALLGTEEQALKVVQLAIKACGASATMSHYPLRGCIAI